MKLFSYIKLLRPANMLMIAFGVGLGFWLAHAGAHLHMLVLLIVAAMCAGGFGNVVNDIADIATDRVSHPKRPLAAGEISKSSAVAFAILCAGAAVMSAFFASWQHGAGTLVPLFLLLLYALFFKGTRLAGNVLVSVLVAYAVIFGGLLGPDINRLFVPAALAFLLNLPREIIKVIQDEPGDRAAGYVTTASLPHPALKVIIALCGLLYAMLVIVPYVTRGFGIVYALACLIAVAPLHIYWSMLFYKSDWRQSAGKISSLIKYEMLCGLLALAMDEALKGSMG
jgi:geranylgeranylglycerol-phosphate geranylgeranyltransferase